MHVRWLQLSGFRNYASLSFEPDPGLNVLIGANGQGKTSLLEAVHLLLAGRSFRTTRLPECVAWDTPQTRKVLRHGETGLLCSSSNQLLASIAQLIDSPELRRNIAIEYYEAGHMMYVHPESMKKFAETTNAFIDGNSG